MLNHYTSVPRLKLEPNRRTETERFFFGSAFLRTEFLENQRTEPIALKKIAVGNEDLLPSVTRPDVQFSFYLILNAA
jgi:hypothetical protein